MYYHIIWFIFNYNK